MGIEEWIEPNTNQNECKRYHQASQNAVAEREWNGQQRQRQCGANIVIPKNRQLLTDPFRKRASIELHLPRAELPIKIVQNVFVPMNSRRVVQRMMPEERLRRSVDALIQLR